MIASDSFVLRGNVNLAFPSLLMQDTVTANANVLGLSQIFPRLRGNLIANSPQVML